MRYRLCVPMVALVIWLPVAVGACGTDRTDQQSPGSAQASSSGVGTSALGCGSLPVSAERRPAQLPLPEAQPLAAPK